MELPRQKRCVSTYVSFPCQSLTQTGSLPTLCNECSAYGTHLALHRGTAKWLSGERERRGKKNVLANSKVFLLTGRLTARHTSVIPSVTCNDWLVVSFHQFYTPKTQFGPGFNQSGPRCRNFSKISSITEERGRREQQMIRKPHTSQQ